MGPKTIVLLALEILLGLFLLTTLGPIAILLGLGLAIVTILVSRRSRPRPNQRGIFRQQPLITPQNPMSLRQFLGLLWIVALVAILFSPSALRFSVGGGSTQPLAESFKAIQPYLASLKSNYHVYVANDTFSLQKALFQNGKKAYFLIGPDEGHSLTFDEQYQIRRGYMNGTLSLLMAEGNDTNNIFLANLFDAWVKGDAVVDYSSPFPDQQVFNTTASLAGKTLPFVIDVGSPIIFGNRTTMWPIASSSRISNDTSFFQPSNKTLAPRTVAAAAQHNNDRAILISDSGPFSTVYNYTWTTLSPNVNETAFTWALTDWVTSSDPGTTIILDNTHYTLPQVIWLPTFGLNVPIGRLFALFLSFLISWSNTFYTGFVNWSRQFILGIALFTAWGFYGILASKYAKDPRGKDDEPVPKIEKNIRAESTERRNFLTTTRNKGFYVATLGQLYDVLDSLIQLEFGTEIGKLTPELLTSRLGEQQGREAIRLFNRLGKVAQYANGQKRILFPPVLRWRATTKSFTDQAERMLNELGVTMTGDKQKKQLDYKLRRS